MNPTSTIRVKALNLAFVLIVFVLILVSKMQDSTISIIVDGEKKQLTTLSTTVEDVIIKEEIALNGNTIIRPALNDPIKDNMEIEVSNLKSYMLNHNGEARVLKSYSSKVKDILEDAGIEFDSDDYTHPSQDETIKSGTSIIHHTITREIRMESIPLSYEIIHKKNSRLQRGIVKIIQDGKEGEKGVYTEDVYIGNRLSYSTPLYETVLSDPTPKIIESGTREMAPLLKGSRENLLYSKTMELTATAYDLSFASTGKNPGDYWYGKTATGTYARPGTVAVDPRVIPLGTKLYVESMDETSDYGFAIAEDTGGAIKGHKIDLFFYSATDVKNFGRRKVKVYILD